MPSKLPPLDLKEDIEKYEALNEAKEIKLIQCTHKHATIDRNTVKCPCGAAWTGTRIHELYKLLTQ